MNNLDFRPHSTTPTTTSFRCRRQRQRAARMIRADVVGPVCESGDYLALNRDIAGVAGGDLIAVMSAGGLWRRSGGHLQFPPSGAGGLGQGPGLCAYQAEANVRGIDRPRHTSALVDVRVARSAGD